MFIVSYTSRKDTPDEKKETRQLLIFSDSRQDAAFFAPYLSHTYFQILRRRLILKTIEENKDNILRNKWRVGDLSDALKHQIIKLNIFSKETSTQVIETKAYNWVLHELLSIDSKIGLDGLGLLGFSLLKPENWQAPPKMKEAPWKLSDNEVWILYQVLLDSFRKNGAVIFQIHPVQKMIFLNLRIENIFSKNIHLTIKKVSIVGILQINIKILVWTFLKDLLRKWESTKINVLIY